MPKSEARHDQATRSVQRQVGHCDADMPSLLELPLTDWTESHVQQVIADQIEEGQRLHAAQGSTRLQSQSKRLPLLQICRRPGWVTGLQMA